MLDPRLRGDDGMHALRRGRSHSFVIPAQAGIQRLGISARQCEGPTGFTGTREPSSYSTSPSGGTTLSGSTASLPAISTAWVRLEAPSLRRIALMCALIVASDTPSS